MRMRQDLLPRNAPERSKRLALLRAVATGWAALLPCAFPAALAPPRVVSAAPAPAAGAPKSDFPAAKALMASRVAQLERDVATRILRRPGTPAGDRGRLDLGIDLRVIERFLWAQAAQADAALQPAAFLRAAEVAAATASLEDLLKNAGPATRSQAEAMVRAHQASYALNDLKTAGAYDDFCKQLGATLANVANPTPADLRAVPVMRPKPVAAKKDPDAAGPPTRPGESDPAAAVSEDVRHANVSAPLRQQLLALLNEQRSLSIEPGQEKAAQQAFQMLSDVADLVKAVQGSTGMDGATRNKLESQLAEGLALFSDPRTQSAGQQRVEALGQYRQVLQRLGRLRLSPEQQQQFAPALGWAQRNTEPGARLLNALDAYADVLARYDALPAGGAGGAATAGGAAVNLRPAVEPLRKQFEARRDAFPAPANDPASSGGPEALDARVNELRQLCELLETLEEMPRTLDVVNAYRPKPHGAIEKRVALAAQAVALPPGAAAPPGGPKLPTRAEAGRFLFDLTRLARASDLLTLRPMDDVPTPVTQAWVGPAFTNFDSRCKGLVAESVAALAAGGDVDRARLARLAAARPLGEALRQAAAVEAAFEQTPPLERWADWAMSDDDLRQLLTPYRDALAAAFAGVLNDASEPIDKWKSAYPRYAPLMALVVRGSAYGEACARFPAGVGGDLARLMTPMDNQPFAAERYASFAVWVWGRAARAGDREGADSAAAQLVRRLGRDLRVPKLDDADATMQPLSKLSPPEPVPGFKPATAPASAPAAGPAKPPRTPEPGTDSGKPQKSVFD